MPQAVYLLHFEEPLAHARHYVGWASNLPERMDRHFSGHGSRLVRAVLEEGISITVARVWWNRDRHFERKLHRMKNSPKLCPLCSQKTVGSSNPDQGC